MTNDVNLTAKPIEASVGVLFGPQQGPLACPDDTHHRFLQTLEHEGIFRQLTEMEPGQQPDMILEVHLSCRDDYHLGQGTLQAAVEGLGLLLPTAMAWRDYDYFIDLSAIIRRDDQTLAFYTVPTQVDADLTFWATLKYNLRPPTVAQAAIEQAARALSAALQGDRKQLETR